MTTKPALQINENDWIQCVGFFTRPQLFRLQMVHPIFHSLIQQYFPRQPYAPTQLAIFVDDEGGGGGQQQQIWVAIAIFEQTSPTISLLEEEQSICKLIRWIGVNGYNQFDENARAMEKCTGIVEMCQDEAHANCPEWHLFVQPLDDDDTNKGCGQNNNNVEFAVFEHFAHLDRDKEIFEKIRQRTEYCPSPQLHFPIRLNVKIPIEVCDGGIHQQQLLMAHLDLPFIQVETVSILEKPQWCLAEENSNSHEKNEFYVMKNSKKIEESTKDINLNLAKQLFNTLASVFTPGHYKNVQMDLLFSHAELIIKMTLLSELFQIRMRTTILNQHKNCQSSSVDILCKCQIHPAAELFRNIAISSRRRFLSFGLENNFLRNLDNSPLKEIICNASNGIRLIFPHDKKNIIEDILPILYSYNPEGNAKCVLKLCNSQEYRICEQLLGILLKDSLLTDNSKFLDGEKYQNNSSLNSIYHLKMEIDDEFDTGWKSVIDKINAFMCPWAQWRKISDEAEQIHFGINADFVLTNANLQQKQRNGPQFYIRSMFTPTSDGCRLKIYRYNICETKFHEKLHQEAQQIAKWWKRCFQLEYAFDGAAINYSPFDWQQDIRHDCLRIIDEDEQEMRESWAKYIMAKWLDNWRNFY